MYKNDYWVHVWKSAWYVLGDIPGFFFVYEVRKQIQMINIWQSLVCMIHRTVKEYGDA